MGSIDYLVGTNDEKQTAAFISGCQIPEDVFHFHLPRGLLHLLLAHHHAAKQLPLRTLVGNYTCLC